MPDKKKDQSRKKGPFRFLRLLSFRTKLFLSYSILILSSATATIFIGNIVFRKNVVELSHSKVQDDLKVAEFLFSRRLERLSLLASTLFLGAERVFWDREFRTVLLDNIPLDFVCFSSKEGMEIHLLSAPARFSVSSQSESYAVLKNTDMFVFAEKAHKSGKPVSSIILLDSKAMEHLGYHRSTGDGLFMVAASPLREQDTVVIGILLNNKQELARTISTFISGNSATPYEVNISLPDRLIASSAEMVSGYQATDPSVTDRVFRRDETYTGSHPARESTYFAYSPLKDFQGRIIGMLGVGTSLQIYNKVLKQTTLLFTALIFLGMLFGFFVSYWLSALLIRPVRELSEGMNRVAKGDLSYKVRVYSVDELGNLARAFNLMVRAVKERDIKLQEMTEEKLSMVEKQVSIGRLAAGVAHEINNPLTSILTLSSLQFKGLNPEDEAYDDLKIVVDEATRCRDIVRGLLDFARESPVQKQVVDIHDIIQNTMSITSKYKNMRNLNLVPKLYDSPLYVNADPKQLQQVFTNIIINAAEASEEGGNIEITTEEDSSGGYVITQVNDHGKGIPEEHMNRIFEPFFTTKGTGKGTGLGLSVSLGIIKKHGGIIEIKSVKGQGTTVAVVLPAAET